MTTDLASDGPTPPEVRAGRPRRRWWSLSVRGLMILVLLVGGVIGWEANRVSRLRRAVAVLERAVPVEPNPDPNPLLNLAIMQMPGDRFAPGSKVGIRFDDQYANGEFQFRNRDGWFSRWTRRLLGADYHRQVSMVTFQRRPDLRDWEAIAALGSVEEVLCEGAGTNDADLVGIDRCVSLRAVTCRGYPFGPVTGKTLRTLATLPRLRVLELTSTQITAADLVVLEPLNQLETLVLPRETETDAGLAHLGKLVNLRSLSTGRISDAGMASLAALTRLETLDFEPWHFTDAGMAALARFPLLKSLRIKTSISTTYNLANDPENWTARITPDGLQTLAGLTRLEALTLDDPTVVDDAWVGAVRAMTRLGRLNLDGDRITDDGLAALRPLVNLTMLDINSPLVTNASLSHLTAMTRLTNLFLTSQADAAGTAQLQTAVPTLKWVSTRPHRGAFKPPPVRRSPRTNRPSAPQ